MEIPRVSLVDGSGRRVGMYSNETEWWQSVKKKQRMASGINDEIASHHQLMIENESARGKSTTPSPPNNFENDLTGSKVKLIESELKTNQKKDIKMSVNKTLSDLEKDEKERERLLLLENNSKQIGETPLHIAIMHDDLPTIRYLIEECGRLIK